MFEAKTLKLVTVAIHRDGCFSVLLDSDGVPFAVTVERTFENFRPVIGNGVYSCHRDYYNKGGYPTFEIAVPGHTRVLFHKGNKETDSLACVIVAESFGMLNDAPAVLDSKGGFAEFMSKLEGDNIFYLEVTGR
jgi:hypothetical protein